MVRSFITAARDQSPYIAVAYTEKLWVNVASKYVMLIESILFLKYAIQMSQLGKADCYSYEWADYANKFRLQLKVLQKRVMNLPRSNANVRAFPHYGAVFTLNRSSVREFLQPTLLLPCGATAK